MAVTVISGGGGIAGADTQVQFNDGGVAGATADLVFNKVTGTLQAKIIAAGDLTFANGWVVTEDNDDLLWIAPDGRRFRVTMQELPL